MSDVDVVLAELVQKGFIKGYAQNGLSYTINLGPGWEGGPNLFEYQSNAAGVIEWAKAKFEVKIPSKKSVSEPKPTLKKRSKKDLQSLDTVPGVEDSESPSPSA